MTVDANAADRYETRVDPYTDALNPSHYVTRNARALVVTNIYPAPTNLYRNAFLHRRVRAYREAGLSVQVFCVQTPGDHRVRARDYHFEGVHVWVGDADAFARHLTSCRYDAYMVHFVNRVIWERLTRHAPSSAPVTIWVHGFEAEAWYRRWFTFIGDDVRTRTALEKRKGFHAEQLSLLREVFVQESRDVAVVNVSNWFADYVVTPDVGAEPRKSEVIPNFVDGDLFRYRTKGPEQRLRVLSIRPYASNKYANDLTVAAIMRVVGAPYFADLHFTLVGAGEMFTSMTRPLASFPNVTLINKFLTQDEISDVHQSHGVFLCPTRLDSQGVSMCEAMSSGLVPVSTDVSAIPEFVSNGHSGLLSPGESVDGLVNSLQRLYSRPEEFLAMSEHAAREVRRQCGYQATIAREIDLVFRGTRWQKYASGRSGIAS